MLLIYHSKIEENIAENIYKKYFCLLPYFYQKKVKRYKKTKDQQRTILSKALLLAGLNKFEFKEKNLKKLKLDKYHRPYLDDIIDFNISHSGNNVVCALSNKGKVGIDIENINPLEISYYIEAFDTEIKNRILQAKNSLIEFYRYWTVIESVLKADGRGMHIPISDVQINGKKAFLKNKLWNIHEIKICQSIICHCATESLKEDIIIKKESFN